MTHEKKKCFVIINNSAYGLVRLVQLPNKLAHEKQERHTFSSSFSCDCELNLIREVEALETLTTAINQVAGSNTII